MNPTYSIGHADSRRYIANLVMQAPVGHVVTISEATRSNDQNRLLWPLLDCLAKQVNWHGQKLSASDWKHVLTSSLKKQRVVPGIDGGFVVMGQSTSRMGKAEFSELIELLYAFGAQHNVNFGGES